MPEGSKDIPQKAQSTHKPQGYKHRIAKPIDTITNITPYPRDLGEGVLIQTTGHEIVCSNGVCDVGRGANEDECKVNCDSADWTNDELKEKGWWETAISKMKVSIKNYYKDSLRVISDPIAKDISIGEAIASQLPGRENGLADAFRHLLWGAELTRRLPDQIALGILNAHEIGEKGASRSLDEYNNHIAIKIGQYVQRKGGTWEDIKSLCAEALEKSFSGYNPNNIKNWKEYKDTTGSSYYTTGESKIVLSNGLKLDRVAVLEPSLWRKNPKVHGKEISITDSNWPTEGWKRKFIYEKGNKAKE